jgi:hypothetical protein
MSSEEQIKEILIRAYSIGFEKQLIERVKHIMDNDPSANYVSVLIKEFQQILNEITD